MEQQSADSHMVHQALQGVVAAFPKLYPLLAHGGEGRGGVGTDGKVVKADDAHIGGNLKAHLLTLHKSRVGDLIVAADDGCDAHLQKAGQMFLHALGGVVGSPGAGGIRLQTVLAEGCEEGLVTHLHDVGAQSVA